ncbi:CHAT domain-containing protein [Thiothrix eikelboomii]|uniref:nSTAND1 domain-containing NTPase n=1 Tax=Thiothrix eikelboomii TaxID=92487 RepID=UPI003BAE8485
MASLQITVQHRRVGGQEHSWPVSAVFDSNDGLPYRKEGTLILPSDWQYELRRLSWDANKYGKFLGEALFKGSFRLIIYQALNEPNFIKVFLNVEAPELTPLRWERLFFPDSSDSWHSLAQHQQLVFSIYLPSLVSRQYPALNKHTLEALVLVASPSQTWKGCKPFDVGQSVANIRTSFEHFNRQPTFLSKPEQVTWEGLKQALKAKHYPILHIVAHGSYDKDKGESYLLLLDEEGQPQKLSATTFINQLKSFIRLPNLIFLCSCNTATPETTQTLDAHEHFARRLLDDLGTPAVIAMTDEVTIMTAELLSKQFYNDLYALAHVDQALAKAGLSLASRLDRYVPVLYQRLGYRPLFTNEPTALNKLNAQEIRHGLTRLIGENGLSGYLYERAPILSSECLGLIEQLDPDNPSEQVLEDLDALCQSITELGFSALAQNEKPSDYVKDCPFPGLRPFRNSNKDEDSGQNDTKDSTDYREFFFGREAKVTELCDRLDKINILMIKGDSGSGKSSLVYAGLLPELKRRCQANHKPWQSIVLRPYFAPNGQSPLVELQRLIEKLDKTQPAVIFVDQFEELFTTCPAKTAYEKRQLHQQFLDVLLELPQQYSEWKLILTMRVDFSGDCALYADLKKVVQDQSELLAPMSIEELRPAIEAQVAKAKLILEQGLLHALLEKVDGEPGAMPLVQYSLWLLWLRRRGRYLLIEEYKKTEAVGNAIGSMAESHFQSYAKQPSDQAYIRNIYLRLVRPDNERHTLSADKYRDTRQRVPKVEFYPKGNNQEHDTGNNKVIIDRLLQELANEERRLIVMYEDSVEIAHEALIQHWSLLNKWLNDGGINLLQQGITEATRAWKIEKHKDKQRSLLIHTGTRLQDIEDYREKQFLFINEQEAEYLNACHLEDRRRARNQRNVRVFAVVMLILFLVAGLVSWLAVKQKVTADGLLIDQYFQTGIELRDNKYQEWDKAQHYFAKALDIVVDQYQRENILYAIADIESFKTVLLGTLVHENPVEGAKVYAADRLLLTWTADKAQIWEISTGKTVGPIMQHTKEIKGALIFADDKLVLTWTEEALNIWDATTGKIMNSRLQNRGRVNNASVVSADQRILTWGANTLHIWDFKTGETITVLTEYKSGINGVEMVNSDKSLLTWGDNRVQIWDVNTGKHIFELTHDVEEIKGVQVFLKSQNVLIWAENGTARIWNTKTGLASSSLIQYDEIVIHGLKLFADDQKVLTWNLNGNARVWSTQTGNPISESMQYESAIWGAQLFSNDQRVLMWSDSGIAIVWDTQTGQAVSKPMIHEDGITEGRVFAFDTQILTLDSTGTARIWSAKTGEAIGWPMRHDSNFVKGAQIFSHDERLLTWAGQTVMQWDIRQRRSKGALLKLNSLLRGVELFADGQRVLIWGADRKAQVWDTQTGRVISRPMESQGEIKGVNIFAFDQRILTWDDSGTAQIWNAQTGDAVGKLIKHDSRIIGAKVFAADQRVLTWDDSGTAQIWDAQTGEAVGKSITHDGEVMGVQLFESDKLVLIWGHSTAQVVDIQTGNPVSALMAHNEEIMGAQVFAAENYVLTWSRDGTAKVWNMNTGDALISLNHDYEIWKALVFADVQRILTWCDNSTARLWDSQTGVMIGEIMNHDDYDDEYEDGNAMKALRLQIFANNSRLLTWDGRSARLWDTHTGKPAGLLMRHNEDVSGAKVLMNGRHLLTWTEKSTQVWDTSKGLALTVPIRPPEMIEDTKVMVDGNLIILFEASALVWKLPVINYHISFLNEIKESLENHYYINSAGIPKFLTSNQLEKCQTLYQPYQECNESDSNLCKVKRQWWSVQKFFGQLPTLEDCLN